MAFQTGTSSGPSDLVTLLATFAAANGWTVGNTSDGYKVLRNTTLGINFSVSWDASNIYIRGCTGYNSGSNWLSQPGIAPVSAHCNQLTGPFKTYYFFGTGQYLHVVIETTTNIFKHIAIGLLNKNSTYTGGEYFDASYHNTGVNENNYPDAPYHRYLFDGSSSNTDLARVRVVADGYDWRPYSNASAVAVNHVKGCVRAAWSITGALFGYSISAFNQRTTLVPIILAAGRPSSLYSLIGSPPDIRQVKMNNLNPGQIITLGTDEWYVFPHIQKTTTVNVYNSSVPSSGMYGYAYKKVP